MGKGRKGFVSAWEPKCESIALSTGLPGSRQEEVIDHRLTEREWAEEWKHLNSVSVQLGLLGPHDS